MDFPLLLPTDYCEIQKLVELFDFLEALQDRKKIGRTVVQYACLVGFGHLCSAAVV